MQSTEDKTYNGHKNYETWVVSMYLDGNYDGEGTYHAVQEIAAEAANKYDLAIRLQTFVEDNIGDLGASLVADLIGAALSEVDWDELAKDKLAEIAE